MLILQPTASVQLGDLPHTHTHTHTYTHTYTDTTKYNRPAMASVLPASGRSSLSPLCMFDGASTKNTSVPSTSSPLSPNSSTSLPPLETSAATTNSHYYRPALSAISSSTH